MLSFHFRNKLEAAARQGTYYYYYTHGSRTLYLQFSKIDGRFWISNDANTSSLRGVILQSGVSRLSMTSDEFNSWRESVQKEPSSSPASPLSSSASSASFMSTMFFTCGYSMHIGYVRTAQYYGDIVRHIVELQDSRK